VIGERSDVFVGVERLSVGVTGEGLQLTGMPSSQNGRLVHGGSARCRVVAIIVDELFVPLSLDEGRCDEETTRDKMRNDVIDAQLELEVWRLRQESHDGRTKAAGNAHKTLAVSSSPALFGNGAR
jgi:hypothetical protein